MPAWILLLKIRNFMIPIPWFIVWILPLPIILITSIFGYLARLSGLKNYIFRLLSESWRVLMLIICLHGIEVRVDTEEESILIKFI
ncbi:MAG: hypothetical protein KAQ97_09935 [Candidatus Fermentibacteraceae bacterium]|nr:hypothetical protein [Candidatus Fermentibacteraceae bacterium]